MIEINKIYNEDCMKTMKKMENNSVDLVITSPPYNRKRNDKYKYYTDIVEDYYMFLSNVINELLRISKGNVFFNIQKNYYNKIDVFKLLGKYCNEICDIIIWEKSNPMPARGLNVTNAYEFIIVFGDKLTSNFTYTKNHVTTNVSKMTKTHKAVMHKDIAFFLINNFSKENDLIYDPFMGTATTAVVAKELKRNYIGSEISKEYCEIAKERILNGN